MLLAAVVSVIFCTSISTSEPQATKCCPCRPLVKPEEREINATEGQNVTIHVEGDYYGGGCKFLFQIKEKEKNITCCYKHKLRERKGLCDNLTQPRSCRKEDEYDVQEIEGAIGWCTLTLFDGKQSDSGLYQVVFPDDRNTKVRERIVNVNKWIDKDWQWWQVMIIIIVTLTVLFIFVVSSICLIYKLMKEDKLNRRHDEDILKFLIESKFEEFKGKLGGRNILGLRDRNYNNIFHMAARPEWKEEMTEVALKIIHENQGKEDPESPLRAKMIFNLASKNNFLLHLPDKMVPNQMLHQNINLNTKNSEGNTPLIIAAKEKQLHVLDELLEKNIKLDIQNNEGYTALHKAVKKKHTDVVKKLLDQNANQNTLLTNGKTPLHTAIENNSLDIVELLVDDLESKNMKRIIREKETEPPLYLAIKLGFYVVAKYLIGKGYTDWQVHGDDEEEKQETVYKLVAAGRRDILKLLIEKTCLKWNEFQKFCLLEAIDKPNKEAVNNIFSLSNVQMIKEEDCKYALERAYEKLSELMRQQDETGQDQENKLKKLKKEIEKVQRIIEKLVKEGENSSKEGENHSKKQVKVSDVNEDNGLLTLKNQKKEKLKRFYKYISELKDTKSGEILKDRVEISEFFLEFNEEFNQIINDIENIKKY